MGFHRRYVAFWLALLTGLAAAAAYFRMLTGFSPWDDEGAFLISVKQYLSGMTLYDQIFSAYGPLYYFYQWTLHSATGLPVSHDVVRISALLPWLAVALTSAWITLRLTRSLVLAACAHLGTSVVLGFFAIEPGHPQELTLWLMVTLAAAPLLAGGRRVVLMLVLGALSAALTLVKINAGAFAVAAVALTLLSAAAPKGVWRAAAWAAGAACVALPPLLMRNHLGAEWARSYCWLAAASAAGVAGCTLRTRGSLVITGRDCVLTVAGFVATAAAILAILEIQGASLAKVYDSLVLLPARVFLAHRDWFAAPLLLKLTALWALVGLTVAILTAWKQPLPGTPAWRILSVTKCLFSAVALGAVFTGRPLLSVVTPFAWLLLFDPNQADDEATSLTRRLLAILTVLQTLYAYPVAGSQFEFVQVFLWIAMMVCVGDSCTWLESVFPLPKSLATWRGVATAAALAAVAVAQVTIVRDRRRTYQAMPSLDLPGARLVHVTPAAKADLHWLVRNLQQECDSFESLPGLPSLNFWTGIEPLTGLNIDAWILSLSAEDQHRVIAAIAGHPRACMVYNRPLTEFWNRTGKTLDPQPLAHYIFANFRSVGRSGDYQLMLRNQRFIEMP